MEQQPVEAIVVMCVQADLFPAFLDFIVQDLGYPMGTFAPIVIPGGPTPLPHLEEMGMQYTALDHYISFCQKLYPEAELVLIAHRNCRYHKDHAPHPEESDMEQPGSDLLKIRDHYPVDKTCYVRMNLKTGRLEAV